MVLKDTRIKLVDFGLAAIQKTRNEGTLSLNPPEVILGFSMKPSAEMWSVGCTLLELATGTEPFSIDPSIPMPYRKYKLLCMIESVCGQTFAKWMVFCIDPKARDMYFIKGKFISIRDVKIKTLEVFPRIISH